MPDLPPLAVRVMAADKTFAGGRRALRADVERRQVPDLADRKTQLARGQDEPQTFDGVAVIEAPAGSPGGGGY